MLPVILCGGYGSRLWPLSRRAWPKQFADLGFQHSLFQQTLLRLKKQPQVIDTPLIIANEQHRFLLLQQLHDIDITPADIILEPCGRNTAAAICLAALWLADQGQEKTPMLILPSDHLIDDVDSFHQAISKADRLAKQDFLTVFGIQPHTSETGYGYIQSGQVIEIESRKLGYKVTAFTEKPDTETAEQYLSSDDHFWNSGMFALSAHTYINELESHNPDLLMQCRKAWQATTHKWEFTFPDEEHFSRVEDVSVDYAVMEHTKKAVMVPLDAGWNDLGSWKTLLSTQDSQQQQNQSSNGQLVVAVNSSDCYVKSTNGKTIGLAGVHDLLVVDTQDALLVAASESSQDVGALVKQLEKLRPESIEKHSTTYRAWGWHKVLARTNDCQINQMQVKPGSNLSFRKHEYHSEHWTVTSGCATIHWQDNNEPEVSCQVSSHESHFIPSGIAYRLANDSDEVLNIIEVQIGDAKDFDNDVIRLN